MRIAFQSPCWPVERAHNGIATYVDILSKGLVARGVTPFVFAYQTNVASKVDHDRIAHSPINFEPRDNLDRLYRRLFPHSYTGEKLRDATLPTIRRLGIRVFEMEEARGDSIFFHKERSLNIVLRLHGPWFLNGAVLNASRDTAFERRVKREFLAIKSSEYITAPSFDVLRRTEEYYGIDLSRAVCIPNPITIDEDTPEWQESGVCKNCILFVGRFDSHKGGDLMLLAMNDLFHALPGISLKFVGPDRGVRKDGKLYSFREFLDVFVDKRVHDSIEYCGTLAPSEINNLRLTSSLVVAPSRYDNFPYVVLESMALGCPVVAGNAGGATEMIDHGLSGYLFNSGDCASLVQTIYQALAVDNKLQDIGVAAREKVARSYSSDFVTGKTLDFYRQSL